MINKKRLLNYGLWVAVVSLVLDILIFQGVITPTQSEFWTATIQRILELLTALGILSNPTKPDGKGFNL